ncbi:hypothetical protein BC792_10392 [Sphingobacterium allocomposti]|uniref:Uncharacterized protein n=1 Tax=Sphingobacterium allocomposti TaxID=415956 RepID=A0A5S5DQ74_9SPHI|nr:hypothetical protein [Sphingobacterium composti Yoo et al. 2007 non Ten et al. 2007]TYP97166.1 hypothetical protein BC792_10392 [Sphingobacterium composti Yoo et al. 2007 non Ten et al. 2007]
MIQRFTCRYKQLFSLVVIGFLFLGSCSKDSLDPEVDEDETILPHEYEMESLTYLLADDDKIDTVKIKGGTEEFINPGNTPMEIQHVETFDDLVKTSFFKIDKEGGELPSDLDISKFKVNVPGVYYENGTFSYYPERFPMSDSEQREPYKRNSTFTFDLKIPAQSKLNFRKSIDRHDITCSFKLVIRNKTTGEKYNVDGKWQGVLRYFNESFSVDEEVLN